MLGKNDAGDHGVTQIAGPTRFVSGSHQIACLSSRCVVERSYTVVNLLKKRVKAIDEEVAPSTESHHL